MGCVWAGCGESSRAWAKDAWIDTAWADCWSLPTADLVIAELMAYEIEPGVSFGNAIRYIFAALAGKLSGADGTTVTIDAGGNPGTTRITATVDANGNRSSVTLS